MNSEYARPGSGPKFEPEVRDRNCKKQRNGTKKEGFKHSASSYLIKFNLLRIVLYSLALGMSVREGYGWCMYLFNLEWEPHTALKGGKKGFKWAIQGMDDAIGWEERSTRMCVPYT